MKAVINLRSLMACILAIALAGCSELPRDPRRTLQRVREQRKVRVGLVENPPWVIRTSGEPSGAEVELVRRFAESLGATPDWYWGGEQQHLEALEHYELDVVAGGLDHSTPWAKKVGFTRPYFEERFLVGAPPSIQPPASLNGAKVSVQSGEETAAYLEKKHAAAIRVRDISQVNGPVAGPDWRLEQLGLNLTNIELVKKKHVVAVPPGENAWLKLLQEFLNEHRGEVKPLLQRMENQP